MKDKTWKTAEWNCSWDELATGEYTVQGVCTFSEEKGVSLTIPFGDISEKRVLRKAHHFEAGLEEAHYEFLYGLTQDGIRLVLGDVQSMGVGWSSSGGTNETLQANFVFTARGEFDPTAPIVSADLEIEGLRDWLDVRLNPEVNNGVAKLKCSGEKKTLQLYQSDRCNIELQYGAGRLVRYREGISIPSFTKVHIDFNDAASLDEFWSYELWRIQSFLAFCFGWFPAINQLQIHLKGYAGPVNVFRGYFPPKDAKMSLSNVPIPFFMAKDVLSRIFTSWMGMKDDELQASKMLASLLGTWSMPFDMMLFATNSMFESLARAGCDYSVDEKALKSLGPIISMADESIRGRLQGLSSLLKRPSYSMLLDSAYLECGEWGKAIIPDWKRFKKEQIKLRNQGAHALGNNREYEKMADHYYAQILLAYVILMKRLKLPDEVLRHFEQSNFLNAARWRVSKHYAISESQ